MKPLILLAWECGYGRGHLSRLLFCADMIVQRGGQPIFVVPPMYMQDEELQRFGKVIAIPVITPALINPTRIKYVNSYADILSNIGFSNVEAMTPAITHWISIFDTIKPDAIVLDYAPIAALAAQFADITGIRVTSGFEAPPEDCPIFGVNVVTDQVLANNQAMIKKINETIDTLSRKLMGRPGPTLGEALRAHTTFVTAIPETDTYDRLIEERFYIGSLSSHKQLDPVVWPAESKTVAKVFAYARDIGQLKPWLDALRDANISVLCHAPVGEKKLVDGFKGSCVSISRKPFNLEGVLSQSDFCINYGSATTVCQTLLAGKPQLMIPADTEKQLIAVRVDAAGVGIRDTTEADRFQGQLDRLLHDSDMKSKAQAIAAKYPQDLLDKRLEYFSNVLVGG